LFKNIEISATLRHRRGGDRTEITRRSVQPKIASEEIAQ